MGRLADILVEDEFDVTVLQPSLTMDLVSIKDVQKAKLVTVPQAPGVNEGWAKTWSQFRNPWVHEPQFVKLLASAGHFATQCNYTIQQTDIIEQLKAEKFDVCLTEMFDHCGIVLMNLLGCKSKIITASTVSMESINPHIGVPNIYSYVPISVAKGTDKMNLKTKIGSIITMLGLRYYYYQFRKEMDKVIGYNFGAEHQLTADLVGESDLLFANSHPALDFAKPSLEKIIDIGGISLPTPKPLDQEWKDLVAKRKKTVFVSFGSVARSIWMPVEWRDSILDAMKQFPDVTFIWKYEKPEDNFTASAPNVKLTAWGPQLDLLASGKIDLFVSHGGLGSVYETSLSGVPAIFVPLFADQFRNAYMCQAKGFAEVATKDRLIDTKFLVDMLGKMLNDDKYKTSAMETARRMKSRPFSSRELFVKWTKFAASEGRLDFLDPAGRKMGFFEYFSLDVVAIFLSAITVVLLVVYLIVRIFLKLVLRIFGSSEKHIMTAVQIHCGTQTTGSKSSRHYRRFVILFVSFFFLAFLHSGFISYNCGIVAKSDLSTSPLYDEDIFHINRSIIDWDGSHLSLEDRRFDFTATELGWARAAGFAGAMFGVPFLGWASPRLGIHLLMSGMGLMVAVACFIHPIVVSWSFPVFVALRFIIGTVLAILFTAAGDVITKWAPMEERGIWVAILTGHREFSALFAAPFGGFLGSSVSWPAIYYSHGGLALIFTVLWILLHKNDPRKIKWLKQDELDQILDGKEEMLVKKAKKTAISPLKLIKTPVIIATWVACCGYYFAVEFAIAFSIVYYSQALHFSISTGGIFAMIALILLLLIKIITGQLSDKLHHISELTRMRIFNSVALFGSAVFFIIASFWEPNGSWMDIAVIVLPVCILGVHSGGYPKCVVIVAKQHSPTVFAYMQLLGCAILVAGSFVVPAMTPTGSHQEWAQVFRIYAAVLVVSNVIFCYWASAEPCEWTKANPETADVEAPPPSRETRRPSDIGSAK
ncbi:unnamed protein product, partial [Mesorhabditis spiculigera]